MLGKGLRRRYCWGRCQHVLRLPLLYATQRTRYVRRKIYIYGLCKGGVAFTNRDGNRYGIYITFIIPILNIRTRILVLYLQFVKQYKKIYGYTV